MFITFFACKGPETGLEMSLDHEDPGQSQGELKNIQWRSHIMPVDYPKDNLGGLDINYSSSGFLMSAFLMRELDVNEGANFYRLYYADNKSGSWQKYLIKSSLNLFYPTQSSNYETNRIKIFSDRFNNPIIFYVDNNHYLRRVSRDGYSWRDEILNTQEVGTFAANYDRESDIAYLATMKRYYNAREVSIYTYQGTYLRESYVYSGNIASGSSTSHLEIVLHQGIPLVFVKYLDSSYQSGRFLMIKNRVGYILANGVNSSGIFNVYWHNGILNSCYRNIVNDRYILSIYPDSLSLRTQRINFSSTSSFHQHCFVSNDSSLTAVRYNLNYGYGKYFETPSEGLSFPLEGIRFVDLRGERVFIGGLDKDSGRPTFLEKL